MAGLIGLLNYLDQRSGREAYGNLLNEYRVQGDPSQLPLGNTAAELDQSIQRQQGGFRGEGGLISGGPPQEFYMRAAALPGYQNLAQQAQVGQQALERQIQAQQWQENNLTAGPRANLMVQQEEAKWRKEREEAGWNIDKGMTNYQAEQVRIDQQNANRLAASAGAGAGQGGVMFGAPPSGYSMQLDPTTNQPVLTPMQGSPDWVTQRGQQQDLTAGVRAIDNMIDFVKRKGSFETGAESGKISAGDRQQVIRTLGVLSNMGVLQQGELELLESQVSDPNAFASLLKNNATVIGKLEGVRERIIQGSKAASSRSPGAASAPPPPAGFSRVQ